MNVSLEVLLVDDLSNMRRLLKNIIKSLGFKTIHEASDGKEGLAVLDEQDIGLIISDWNMPNMTGIEFLKRIRSSEKHKNTPFLMVTAEATRENIIEAIGAGASNYVVKPVQADVLEAKLRSILGKS
ncbi:MAG: response regulator [Desulfobacteraceae bacterium]|jgi:two-component system chemotaxis response regulator CheY